jgi:FtsZ-binding cell division protein ZapB
VLANHFDPATREERDYQNGMTQFYSLQLCDSNKTIELLQERINQLQNDNQLKVTELQGKVNELMIKNQALKSKIEFMQINPSMFVGRNTSF